MEGSIARPQQRSRQRDDAEASCEQIPGEDTYAVSDRYRVEIEDIVSIV